MLCIFNIHELCIATVREYNMLSDSKQELSIRVLGVNYITQWPLASRKISTKYSLISQHLVTYFSLFSV